ncbi:NADH pyrophosphatase [anaerobic digester metagenome]
MAPTMTYALRAEPVLTRDGVDVLDGKDLHLLLSLRNGGEEAAAANLGVSPRSMRLKVWRMESRVGGKVLENGRLTPLGFELVDRMERYAELLEAQLQHLWRKPSLTCDGLVLRDGKVLLVRRAREPFKGCHALPGGFLEYGERAEDCVVREVREETGLDTEVVRLLNVYSEMGRDPRGHFVTLLYLLREKGGALQAGDDADSAGFFGRSSLPEMAFDHRKMILDNIRAVEHPL